MTLYQRAWKYPISQDCAEDSVSLARTGLRLRVNSLANESVRRNGGI
jgi:hypothetical protein